MAMAQTMSRGRRQVFTSVFGPAGQGRDEPPNAHLSYAPSAESRQWAIITENFSLIYSTLPVLEQLGSIPRWDSSLPECKASFGALRELFTAPMRKNVPLGPSDFRSWYTEQMRDHFRSHVRPLFFQQISSTNDEHALLSNCLQILQRVQKLYLRRIQAFTPIIEAQVPEWRKLFVPYFQQVLNDLVASSVPEQLWSALHSIVRRQVNVVLGISSGSEKHIANVVSNDPDHARQELIVLLQHLAEVGLAPSSLQSQLGSIMETAMKTHIVRKFSRNWSPAIPSTRKDDRMPDQHGRRSIIGQSLDAPEEAGLLPRYVSSTSASQCVAELCEWIEDHFARLSVEMLNAVTQSPRAVAWNDVESWKVIAIERLAELRISELYDIVGSWPNCSGALDDLRTAVTTPQIRLRLTDVYAADLQEHLLHAGTSTLQILRTYISMIWSFHSLDHSRVLLDRVAFPLQVYLCSREDTVKIIITGLLSETKAISGNPVEPWSDRLTELAVLLDQGSNELGQRVDEDLDWGDMDWVPDPVDAGPGYKRTKSADIIGTLIAVLGSQEVFIKEFQNILSENLLKHEDDFEREIKLLELLKTRFGEAPLQACEVMVKDIQDSRRLDGAIRRAQGLELGDVGEKADLAVGKPAVHAKILSRLFWPQLNEEDFNVPTGVHDLEGLYEQGFETLKNSRKLTWLHFLGHATVELQLQDRVVLEEVHTWQAAVIHAFQDDGGHGDSALTLKVEQLVDQLAMEEPFVRLALNFWVGKMVLEEVAPDEYAVLETLNPEDRERSNKNAQAAAVAATEDAGEVAMLASGEVTAEKMQMYWQFIQGMLRNSAAQMPLQQIAMMLKMLIADGFPYSHEELQEFLTRKVTEGELEINGGKYKLKK